MALINSGNYAAPLTNGDEIRFVEGFKLGYITETITPDGSATYDLEEKLPAAAVVLACEVKLSATVVATTAVKIGVGRKESTADPDKYALTSALTAATYRGTKVTVTPVLADATTEETIQVVACDTNGAAAGTLDSGGDITVKLWYRVTETW
jgi:hypothetical protein